MMARQPEKPTPAPITVPIIRVLGGHSAPVLLYKRVEELVSKRMQTLIADKLYTLEQIIGKQDWATLSDNWTKRMAGRCFAHMVSVRTFPLKFVQYKRYCTKRYQLK